MARELSAYDFASEMFALSYTQQPATPSKMQGAGQGGCSVGFGAHIAKPRKTTHNVPLDFATVQDAIDAAQDGDVVRISPGRYKEALVLQKRVLLVGVGKVGDTVLEAPDESIFFAASAMPTVSIHMIYYTPAFSQHSHV